MATSGAIPSLSLPRSWSERVRSAILLAISLARFAVTHGRAHVTGSCSASRRQRVEIDRLEQGSLSFMKNSASMSSALRTLRQQQPTRFDRRESDPAK